MLQQTTVTAVIPYYKRWMRRFPTVEALAQADRDEVLMAWSGLGYYSRAHRLHDAAKAMVLGGIPSTFKGWLALPGIGPYTAAAVASIAQGQPHLALDTNALRVLLRISGWKVPAHLQSVHVTLREWLETSLHHTDFSTLNQALMELGALLCQARQPLCSQCPLAPDCLAHATGTPSDIPLPKTRPSLKPTPGIAYLLPIQGTDDESLLVQGTSLGLLSSLYQPLLSFPDSSLTTHPINLFIQNLASVPSTPLTTLSYPISGRKLHLEIRRFLPQPEARMLTLASSLGLKVAILRRQGQPPLSTLARKLLKEL